MADRRLLVGALLLLAFVGTGRADDAKKDDKADVKPVVVPFELLKSGHMATMIKINGKGPYRVIFDTGAPMNLLNTKVAKDSGLIKDGPGGFALFGGMTMAKMQTLEVGDLKLENASTMVMNHPTVEAISKALGPIEGIIGFPFFARYKMTLDYQAKQMTFVPNGYEPPDVIASLMSTMMSLMGSRDKPPPKVLAPAALWGLVVAKEAGDEEAGVTVKEVHAGSAAAEAGLKPGDRLLVLDTRWTDTLADTYAAAGFVKPGTTVTVRVKRDGKEIDLTVKPAAGL
jgi:membrane-associated protease RseP (regulator of RpoE activity)